MDFLKFVLDLKSLRIGDIHQFDYMVRDMTEFYLHEINYIGNQLQSSAADFLICLLERLKNLDFNQNPALPDLIQEVGRLKLSRSVRKKIATLLIKQQIHPPLLAPYLEPFPTLAQLYYNNHELAEQLSAFLQEINS